MLNLPSVRCALPSAWAESKHLADVRRHGRATTQAGQNGRDCDGWPRHRHGGFPQAANWNFSHSRHKRACVSQATKLLERDELVDLQGHNRQPSNATTLIARERKPTSASRRRNSVRHLAHYHWWRSRWSGAAGGDSKMERLFSGR